MIPNEIRRMSGENIIRPAIATTISNVLLLEAWNEEIDRRIIRRSGRYLLVCNITQPRCNELIDVDDLKSEPLATCHTQLLELTRPTSLITNPTHRISQDRDIQVHSLDLKRAKATAKCRCLPPGPSGLHRIRERADHSRRGWQGKTALGSLA